MKDNIIASGAQAVKLLRDRHTEKDVAPEALQKQLAKEQIYIALPLLKLALQQL